MLRYVLVITVLILSVSVTAQPPWQPPRTPDGQPDMQGLWRHTESGADRAVLFFSIEGNIAGREVDFLGRDQFNGVVPPTRSVIVDPPDGKIPYHPWLLEKRQAFIANAFTPTELEHVDPVARGWPGGVPRQIPGATQILQGADVVVVLSEQNHTARLIRLDGGPHPGKAITLMMGDSRGRWEGNTLVVDVTNQDKRTWLDFLSFQGDNLHVTERWTVTGPDRLDYTATLTDPSVFTRPWTIAYPWIRDKTDYEVWEFPYLTAEGRRNVERMLSTGRKAKGR